MLDRDKYLTEEENLILENDIRSQLSKLKNALSKKENFVKKDIKISVMKEGDKDADESV